MRVLFLAWVAVNIVYLSFSLPDKYQRLYNLEPSTFTGSAFSAGLRQEINLGQIEESLVGVVQETMQPNSVSLWVRDTMQSRRT